MAYFAFSLYEEVLQTTSQIFALNNRNHWNQRVKTASRPVRVASMGVPMEIRAYKGIYIHKIATHYTSKGRDSKFDNRLNVAYNLTDACSI